MKKTIYQLHHISYDPPITIKVSRGVHLILTSFQQIKPTFENINYIRNVIFALTYIAQDKEKEMSRQIKI